MKKLNLTLIVILIVIAMSHEGELQIAKQQGSHSLWISQTGIILSEGIFTPKGTHGLYSNLAGDYSDFFNPGNPGEVVKMLEDRKSQLSLPWMLSPDLKKGFESKAFSPSSKNTRQQIDSHTLTGGVQEAWVKHYESNLVSSRDVARAIYVDDVGNVYITGTVEGTYTDNDYATIKYNPSGIKLWTAYYNGPTNDFDVPSAMAVDKMGNVYVTGGSYSSTKFDYCTIKYNSHGVEQWVTRHNGSADGYDWPNDIAVDDSGNVYVTGSVESLESSHDYLTIKYNSLGEKQWIARYNGAGNGNDGAAALVVDDAGNVYVTGTSVVSDPEVDYTTVKYNSVGIEQWAINYNGTANSEDYATAIAIDDSSNVYVTGVSMGLETNLDYVTIKYNSDGQEIWKAGYNGPASSRDNAEAIVVDQAQNIYVTGWSKGLDTNEDYATIKYNSEGEEQWVARYNGAADDVDYGYDLVVDNFGNVYVTIKYDSTGENKWIARYNGIGNGLNYASGISADNLGNIYVTGSSDGIGTSTDFVTIKYNTDGIAQWCDRFDGPRRSYDFGVAMVMDDSENVYVTGLSHGSGSDFDIVTVKYDASGVLRWVSRYSTPEKYDEMPNAITLDNLGNVYVTGFCDRPNTFEDYLTVKCSAEGIIQWAAYYNGTGNADDEAAAIAVDCSGDVYITGRSRGIDTQFDYATIKYNSSGIEQWVARYNGSGNEQDEAIAIGVDDSCNVYVTGSSWGENTKFDYITIKYNSMGVEQWRKQFNGLGNGYDQARDFCLDNFGNIYVTGYSESGGTSIDYATIKYNSAGDRLWVSRYDNVRDNYRDMATAIAVDRSGNVYVTGETGSSSVHYQSDYTTVKYNSAGQQQWARHFSGPGDSDDVPADIAVDSSGNVYVTGESFGFDTDYDIVTVKYESNGFAEWTARYNGPGNACDKSIAVAVHNSGNIYVAGSSWGKSWCSFTTIKYSQTPASVKESYVKQPGTFWLAQNYPNPFNPTTTIRFSLPHSDQVRLAVFNIRGQLQQILFDGVYDAGHHEITWDASDFASGIYFVRLESNRQVRQIKMCVIK